MDWASSTQRVAAIGEDDHTVEYKDGEKFCSKCHALLWDPNVHHCPAKQARRVAAHWADDPQEVEGLPAMPCVTPGASLRISSQLPGEALDPGIRSMTSGSSMAVPTWATPETSGTSGQRGPGGGRVA